MNADRFRYALDTVLGSERTKDSIGTYSEGTLHAVLKCCYEPDSSRQELKIGRYIADIVGQDGIIEIQTRQLFKMKDKIKAFLSVSADVTVVYPVAAERNISWLNIDTGEITERRRSPKHDSIYTAIEELYPLSDYISDPLFHFIAVVLVTEEYKNYKISKKGKRKDVRRIDRIPTDFPMYHECGNSPGIGYCPLLTTDRKPHFLTKSGKEVVVDTTEKFELSFYGSGFCPYNAQRFAYPWPDDGPYCYDHPEAGKWGFIDTEGNVVIEPQYVYAIGPYGYECEEEYFVVAKMIDGNPRWGVLDHTGTETIPCQYTVIQYTDYDMVVYQEENNELYGLMKIDGTVLLKPKFATVYDVGVYKDRIALAAGTDIYFNGVYSLEKDRFIVPCRFHHIFLLEEYIEACYPSLSDYEHEDIDVEEFNYLVKKNNIVFGGFERFDYEGNLLDKM